MISSNNKINACRKEHVLGLVEVVNFLQAVVLTKLKDFIVNVIKFPKDALMIRKEVTVWSMVYVKNIRQWNRVI